MAMYVVLGDGEMPAADLKATLDDLENAAVAAGATFWLTVRATSEPNATDRALMAWLAAHETYYETVGPEANSAADIYAATQEKHTVKGIAKKVLELMKTKPEDDETATLLALFVSDDPDAPEDAELYEAVEAVLDAGFPVLAFNDGLAPIKLSEGEEPAAEAESETPAPVAAAAKKAGSKTVTAPAKVTDEEVAAIEPSADPSLDDAWATRENLEGLEIEEIKVIAARFGITLPPRTRVATYVEAILNRYQPAAGPPEAEVETPEEGAEFMTEVHSTLNGAADAIKSVLRSIGEAFISAANR